MATVRTPPSLDALVPSWTRHLRAANLSPRTVQSYAESARRLGAFLDQRGMPSEVDSIRREHVEAFIEDLLANWSPATAEVRYRSLQQLFRWLIDEGEISVSPMARMRPPKVPEQPVAVLTLDEQRRLLATCEGRSFVDRRDAAMLRVFIDTGARLAEVAGLLVATIELDDGMLLVMGKGRRERRLPIGSRTVKALDRPPSNLSAAYRDGGWINVLLVASDGRQIRLVTDSMYYDPDAPTEKSRWLTSPAAREARETLRSNAPADSASRQAAVQRLEDDLSSPAERPEIIKFSDSVPPTGAARTPPGWPYFGCTVNYIAENTVGFQNIADVNLQNRWQVYVEYVHTDSTSFEVGYSADGGSWQVAGSASFSQSSERGWRATYPVSPLDEYLSTSFQIEMNYAKIQWRCSHQSSPSTFFPYTNEPTQWLGGTRNDLQPIIRCHPDHRKQVSAGGSFWKHGGSSATWSASGGAFGFDGKASVGYESYAKFELFNRTNETRDVCGESDNPIFGNSRVQTK